MGPSLLPDESRETWGTAWAEVSMADILQRLASGVSSRIRGLLEHRQQLASGVYLRGRGDRAAANISRARRLLRRPRFKRSNAAGRR